MKTHWIHCKNIADALTEIIDNGHNTAFVVKKYTTSKKQGSRDRRLIATAIFEMVKNYRYYRFLGHGSDDNNTDWRPPVSAYLLESGYTLPSGSDWPVIEPSTIQARKKMLSARSPILLSMPDWLYDIGYEAYGEKWNKLCDILRSPAPIYLRVNLLLTDINKISRYFAGKNIDHTVLDHESIRLHQRLQLSNDEAYLKGWFEIQDIGSQRIGQFVNPVPGSFIIDACAGAGGKSLHLATIMENKGDILALDVNDSALQNLSLRAKRHGAEIISATLYDHLDNEAELVDGADYVLCDVPCSGSGVFRREVEKKINLTPDQLQSLIATQSAILERASQWVKPGGILIYATCSILPAENQAQAKQFITRHPSFRELDSQLLLPQEDGNDGFFMVKFVKEIAIE